jgi:hypothetical protein
MGKTFVVRYEMRPDAADENQRLVERVFAELSAEQPDGLRYACYRLDDGVTFVHVGTIEEGDPLGGSAAFQEFQREFGDRVAGQPAVGNGALVGSYGFLPD